MPAPIITTAAFVWSLLPTGTSGHGFELPMVASFSGRQTHSKNPMKLKRYEYGKQCALAGTKAKKERKEKKGSRYVSHMHPMLQGGYMCSKTLFNSRTTGLYWSVPRLLLLRKTLSSILNRVIGFRRARVLMASPTGPLRRKPLQHDTLLWYPSASAEH